MSEELVQRFIDGLRHLEQTRDPEPLIATYAEQSETSNVVAPRTYEGHDGAREFWRRYRGAFGEVNSTFRNVIVAGDRAALEWTTEGTSPEGEPFRYDGVSILELAEGGEGITRFRAFFDSASLGHQMHEAGAATAAAARKVSP